MDDEEWIEAEMDEYFHQQPDEEYIDPNDYSYVDPRTGLTPKQQAWLDYQQALDDYEANWIGTPYMDRTEGPPQWEDFWREPAQFQRPQYKPYQPKPRSDESLFSSKAEKNAFVFFIICIVFTILILIMTSL